MDVQQATLRASLRAQVKGCVSCPLHQRCSSPVPWRGGLAGDRPRPRLVIIGEAPSKGDDHLGRVFTGVAGALLTAWVRGLCDEFNGLTPEEVSYVNVVSCWPNRTPSVAEVHACRPTLHRQLSAIHPDMAIVLGGVAVSSFWKDVRIGDIRGKWWGLPVMQYPDQPEDESKPPLPGYYIPAIATWPPAAVSRGNGADDVLADLAQVRMALYPGAFGPFELRVCFMCGEEATTNERYIACDLGMGRDVTEEKGAPLSLVMCEKHHRQRYGKAVVKKRVSKKAAAAKIAAGPGLFGGG